MGDMAAVFKDLEQAKKERSETRRATNVAKLVELGIDAKEQSKNVFRIELTTNEFSGQRVVMYYPTSCKWQHRGKTYGGTPEQLKVWLLKNSL